MINWPLEGRFNHCTAKKVQEHIRFSLYLPWNTLSKRSIWSIYDQQICFSHGPICKEMAKCLGVLWKYAGRLMSQTWHLVFSHPPTSHSAPTSLVIPPWLPCHLRLSTTTHWQSSPNVPPPIASDFLFANYAFFFSALLSRIRPTGADVLEGESHCEHLYGGWVTRPPNTNWREHLNRITW